MRSCIPRTRKGFEYGGILEILLGVIILILVLVTAVQLGYINTDRIFGEVQQVVVPPETKGVEQPLFSVKQLVMWPVEGSAVTGIVQAVYKGSPVQGYVYTIKITQAPQQVPGKFAVGTVVDVPESQLSQTTGVIA